MYDTLIERLLTQSVTEALHSVELSSFLWHMPEGVAEHSFLGCNRQSTCMPSYSL